MLEYKWTPELAICKLYANQGAQEVNLSRYNSLGPRLWVWRLPWQSQIARGKDVFHSALLQPWSYIGDKGRSWRGRLMSPREGEL